MLACSISNGCRFSSWKSPNFFELKNSSSKKNVLRNASDQRWFTIQMQLLMYHPAGSPLRKEEREKERFLSKEEPGHLLFGFSGVPTDSHPAGNMRRCEGSIQVFYHIFSRYSLAKESNWFTFFDIQIVHFLEEIRPECLAWKVLFRKAQCLYDASDRLIGSELNIPNFKLWTANIVRIF